IGLTLFASAIAVVAYGFYAFNEARSASGGGAARGGPTERVFAVDIGEIENTVIEPVITAYGDIRSWRSLELRASSGGYIVDLAENFRDGEEIAEGDLLFKMDPDDAEGAVQDAQAALDDARADLAEAKQAVAVAAQELKAAETQRDLRDAAWERRKGLRSRGVSTEAEVEEAELAFAAAAQTVASRSQMLLAADVKIERTELRVRRAEIALANAERRLAETAHRAPFDGLLTDVAAVLGGFVSVNERLGVLIDPTALEAAFRVTNAQYARLLDENGRLKAAPVTVTLELDDAPVTTRGVIDRAGAIIETGQTGRLIFARLDLSSASLFRPGDFITVSIDETPLKNVARVPAAAVLETGEILLVGDDDRLIATETRILRRQGDHVIVSGAPDGARFARERAPQLGAGIKVRAIAPDAATGAAPATAGANARAGSMVELDPKRQERLIGFVEGADRMPTDMKVRVLSALRSGRAPAEMIERIEARMGESG
ncbi:MAG: HlyD family efflux transporter periplasmic adaptor subunit, partial [Pseudomonadota bacterium]